jgi:hypothetical protein
VKNLEYENEILNKERINDKMKMEIFLEKEKNQRSSKEIGLLEIKLEITEINFEKEKNSKESKNVKQLESKVEELEN